MSCGQWGVALARRRRKGVATRRRARCPVAHRRSRVEAARSWSVDAAATLGARASRPQQCEREGGDKAKLRDGQRVRCLSVGAGRRIVNGEFAVQFCES